MWLNNAGQQAVSQFWLQCGELEPFPRNLERSVALAVPVALIKLSALMLADIEKWCERRGLSLAFDCQNRALRGCLIAYGGSGLIFIDGSDPDHERRFTLAHEIAHFLVDYLQLREIAISRFGDQITDVVDGLRPATYTERVHAVLSGTKIGIHTKLIDRQAGGEAPADVWEIETNADRVALALLAPPEIVLSQANTSANTFDARHQSLTQVLCEYFGLPRFAATVYADSLLFSIGRGPSWSESLRLV